MSLTLTPSFFLRLELIPILEKHNLKLLEECQIWHKGKKSTRVKVCGRSGNGKEWKIKEFLIMSYDAHQVARIIDKNWY